MLCLGTPMWKIYSGVESKFVNAKGCYDFAKISINSNDTRLFRRGRSFLFTSYSSIKSKCSRSTLPLKLATDGNRNCRNAKTLVKGMTYVELEAWVQSLGYRASQALMLWKCLYGNGTWAQHADEMQGLSKRFREALEKTAEFSALSLKDVYFAVDGTCKILFRFGDGLVIETVVIPCRRGRTTVCVSSQVGCAMNCQFCYTGRMGLKKNLTAAEIVEQVVYARRLLSGQVGPITNVVFMGMGEPLDNFDNVMKAIEIMVHCHGLYFSPHKVSVSTSGLVPQLRRFIRESPCGLAVSLNATTDEVRDWIMPINRKYNLDELLTTLREEISQRRKFKVLFEYVMLAGINDRIEDAKRLVHLIEGIPCKINLISFNPHKGSPFTPSSEEQMLAFRNIVADAGYTIFIRYSRGEDQMAACGQLGHPGNSQLPLMQIPERFQAVIAS